ncbi:hypothetical protein IWW36_005191 [Coemansia brasiliensis]|uniref:SCP domain-containing protein n=1 Tax=Coemansia brasiliensis TaxID=2650707 RepID=A0A9W8LYC5_9FUNG|nr:hypothetical protein IWW36_005191 [Coemansia brasiliensis]
MVKLAGSLALAASLLLGSLVASAPVEVVPEQARRDYHEVNHHYQYNPIQNVAHTITKVINGVTNRPSGYMQSPEYPSDTAPAQAYQSSQAGYQSTQPGYQSTQPWMQEMLQQVNAIRAEVGKPPLRIDQRLNSMAQAHSNYQASVSTMTHSDPAGGLGDRCSEYGIDWRGVAENVAWNYKDVTDVVTGWKNSPGHYTNMVGDYNVVGFGVTDLYWTQDFAHI